MRSVVFDRPDSLICLTCRCRLRPGHLCRVLIIPTGPEAHAHDPWQLGAGRPTIFLPAPTAGFSGCARRWTSESIAVDALRDDDSIRRRAHGRAPENERLSITLYISHDAGHRCTSHTAERAANQRGHGPGGRDEPWPNGPAELAGHCSPRFLTPFVHSLTNLLYLGDGVSEARPGLTQ